MELTSIYEIVSIEVTGNKINAMITFDQTHPVFEGHFPGNPVVPGVVQVQILKDLLEQVLDKKIFLNRTKFIKFLNVIIPTEEKVHFEILQEKKSNNETSVKCIVKAGKQVFMKYSGYAVL